MLRLSGIEALEGDTWDKILIIVFVIALVQ